MSFEYSSVRSTTPPLYYHTSESASASYQPCYPRHPTATPHLITSAHEGTYTGTASRRTTVSTPYLPVVSYPFATAVADAKAPAHSESQAPLSEAHLGYPGFLHPTLNRMEFTVQTAADKCNVTYPTVTVAEMDSNCLASEELRLRATLSELRLTRRRHEEEQLLLSHGWAALLEAEERYYTQSSPNFGIEIATHMTWCTQLKERCGELHARAATVHAAVKALQPLIAQRHCILAELDRIQQTLVIVEQRRQKARARAEQYFDLEIHRGDEAKRLVYNVEKSLRHSSTHAPLAELIACKDARLHEMTINFSPGMASFTGGFTTKGKEFVPYGARLSSVSFAGISDTNSTFKSVISTAEAIKGVPNTDNEESDTQTAAVHSYRSVRGSAPSCVLHPYHNSQSDVTQNSMHIGVDDDSSSDGNDGVEQCLGQCPVGGQSVVFSLNNADGMLSKRRRTELLSSQCVA